MADDTTLAIARMSQPAVAGLQLQARRRAAPTQRLPDRAPKPNTRTGGWTFSSTARADHGILGALGGRQSEVALVLPGLHPARRHNLTFLHWPVDPAGITRFFPPGVRPDVFDGVSYVGLVPFQMRGAGRGGCRSAT